MKYSNLILLASVVMSICGCSKQQNDVTWQEASGNVITSYNWV